VVYMASEITAPSDATLTGTVGKLFFSTVRLSGAATLFGVQQVEAAFTVWQDGDSLSRQIKRFETTVDSLSECLVDDISPGKKEALQSVSSATGRFMKQSFEFMSFLDPRELLRVANNMAQKSSQSVSGWVGRKDGLPDESPRLAVDVLAS
jgi:hypothetical protein